VLRLLRRSAKDRSGGPAIEFALVAPVLLMALIGAVEFGWYFLIRNTLEYAVEEAGRYAVLHKTATQTDIQTQVRNNVIGVAPTSITVSFSNSGTGTNVTYKTITASGTYNMLTGALPLSTLTLYAATRVPVPD
jgi:Flp pilus assembly protein TadG